MKQSVNPFDHSAHICNSLKKGILITTAAKGTVNTMTIGWGHIGIEWGKPIFIAYVRESRYTKALLEENGEFAVNIPYGDYDPSVLGYCGKKSGRDCDKIQDMNLTLEAPNKISVPGIREFPLTLECKVIYKQKQELTYLPEEVLARYYPADAEGFQDPHIAYYGEILDAYLIQP